MEKYLNTGNRANELFIKACQSINKFKVSPTPINYQVWYEYHLGENKDLVKIINEFIQQKQNFNDLLGYRIYASYLRSLSEDIHLINDGLIDTVKAMSGCVTSMNMNINEHLHLVETNETISHDHLAQLKSKISSTMKTITATAKTTTSFNQQIQKVATFVLRDPITLLNSQEKLKNDYSNFVNVARQTPAIAILDIDNFRHFNRSHGISSTEGILRAIGGIIKDSVGIEHAYRIKGHDEFCIMTGDPEGAIFQKKIEDVIEKISNMTLRRKDDQTILDHKIQMTYFIVTPQNENLEKGLERAKKRINYLKRMKRNRKN